MPKLPFPTKYGARCFRPKTGAHRCGPRLDPDPTSFKAMSSEIWPHNERCPHTPTIVASTGPERTPNWGHNAGIRGEAADGRDDQATRKLQNNCSPCAENLSLMTPANSASVLMLVQSCPNVVEQLLRDPIHGLGSWANNGQCSPSSATSWPNSSTILQSWPTLGQCWPTSGRCWQNNDQGRQMLVDVGQHRPRFGTHRPRLIHVGQSVVDVAQPRPTVVPTLALLADLAK